MTEKDQENQLSECRPREPGSDRRQGRVVDARDLLGADGAVTIRHRGQSYILRETRQGKLILNK